MECQDSRDRRTGTASELGVHSSKARSHWSESTLRRGPVQASSYALFHFGSRTSARISGNGHGAGRHRVNGWHEILVDV